MDRAEATGLGVSTAAHVALFVALSVSLAVTRLPPPTSEPIAVSFVKDVGMTNAAPQPSPAPPAQSKAPDTGAPEEAAPQPPLPAPIPPKPQPAPAPAKAVKTPEPRSKPAPRPARPARPEPKAAPAPPAPARPAPARAEPAQPTARSGTGKRTRGTLLGHDFLKGIGSDPTPSHSQQAQASMMSAEALAGIAAAIQRQIQPCANRQVNPGPGADQIKVALHLRLNRDGSLAQKPTVLGTTGVTAGNSRYEDRVKDLAIAAYVGCAPLRDLPDNLYQTPQGGWSSIKMTYKLP
ncbi:MAG TPA: cell envelope biogenesis protein TolA [Allosphingosinicella sp.]|nr:cell envelope biogenesis protein TolA [Allosphingosinicella sp.]